MILPPNVAANFINLFGTLIPRSLEAPAWLIMSYQGARRLEGLPPMANWRAKLIMEDTIYFAHLFGRMPRETVI